MRWDKKGLNVEPGRCDLPQVTFAQNDLAVSIRLQNPAVQPWESVRRIAN